MKSVENDTSGISYWFNDVTWSLTVPLWDLPLVEAGRVQIEALQVTSICHVGGMKPVVLD